MQQSRTVIGMLSGAGVTPSSDPRLPSWKSHTIAPSTALSTNALRISALRGITTLPVNRNSSTNIATATTASTRPNRSTIAARLSISTAAAPPTAKRCPVTSGSARIDRTSCCAVSDCPSTDGWTSR
jgi:hypothetical protein